jgi:hypothetical protein
MQLEYAARYRVTLDSRSFPMNFRRYDFLALAMTFAAVAVGLSTLA